ncbi:MAG TPA: radical SAM protein [Anaerolineae bacterium]|nr:radical SAM protein [Anaerolineae bacterium]HQH39385.1 radical SAM protein [Anaerolineae bacterium]
MMIDTPSTLIFGPVPSRRLGRSLGINHIPPKTCTYACVYCQLGRTSRLQITRQRFYAPETIVAAVKAKLAALARAGEAVDYLTLVPDGEPTLDLHLRMLLMQLKPLGLPLAVITNASLLDEPAVQEALLLADWVSLKVDAAAEATWRHVDRPHGRLLWANILDGAREFARRFAGALVTETMLVAGLNNAPDALAATAAAVAELHPAIAYLSVPTRPPAEAWVKPPTAAALTQAYHLFTAALPHVELLTGYEGNAFAATGDAAADLLSITAVHPLCADAVGDLLAHDGATWEVVDELTARGALVATPYNQHIFYLRGYTIHEN